MARSTDCGRHMMRMMVTGGAGFIGSTLVDRLLAEGHQVDVVDDLSMGRLNNLADARSARGGEFSFHQLDVRSPEVVELIGRRRPEVIFHLAAQAGCAVLGAGGRFRRRGKHHRHSQGARRRTSRAEPRGSCSPGAAELFTASPTTKICPSARPLRTVRFLLTASPRSRLWTTWWPSSELHSFEFCALALANVYGPRQDPHGEAGVVAIFAAKMIASKPATIFGSGAQTRDFVFVDDVVDAMVRAGTVVVG